MSTRRTLLQCAMLGGALSLSSTTRQTDAPRLNALEALRQALSLGRRLRRGELSPSAWQDDIATLLRRCSVTELIAITELHRLGAYAPVVSRGASIVRVPSARPLCREEGSAVRLFFFERGRADPPHCHYNMVTAHMVLIGRFRVRHFARLSEQERGVVLRPSDDRVIGPGSVTTISDERDNAHWHQALTAGVLLNIQQGRLDPSLPIRRRQMLDPQRGEVLADGSLLAPRLTREHALQRYG